MGKNASPIAVLLGAGASADAGIPTTVGMTDAVIQRIRDPDHVRALEYVRHTLAASAAARGSHDTARVDVDIERLFASVELLIDRYDQPWSPFVSAWSPGLESFSSEPRVRAWDIEWDFRDVDDALREGPGYGARRRGTLAKPLARAMEKVFRRLTRQDVGELLALIRDEMLRSLRDVLRIDADSPVEYLNPLIDLSETWGSLTIATLNYDITVEEAARRRGVACDTGLETWLTRGELDWVDDGIHLLKLHGSIDWAIEDQHEFGQLPLKRVRVGAAEDSQRLQPAVVFGEAGKLRSEGPYIELLLAWASELKQAETLVVVGYSFRDQHVNELISRWSNADSDRRIVLVDPANPDAHGYRSFAAHLPRLNEQQPNSRPNPVPRFTHFQDSTATALKAALNDASARPSAPASSAPTPPLEG